MSFSRQNLIFNSRALLELDKLKGRLIEMPLTTESKREIKTYTLDSCIFTEPE